MSAQGHFREYLAAAVVLLVVITSGSCFGWVTPLLPRLLDPLSDFPMTPSEVSWMIAVLEIGNVLSPLFAGVLADVLGRKFFIFINGPIFIISWITIAYTHSMVVVYVCRIVQGAAFGLVFTVVPLYLGEIASAEVRGTVTGVFQTAFYGGMLFEYVIGPFVKAFTLTMLSLIFPVIFVLCFIWAPESPYYFIVKEKYDRAEESLKRLRGSATDEEVKEELETMKKNVKEEMCNKASWMDVIGSASARRALLIVNIAGGVKVFSGIPAILSYATQLFSYSDFVISADTTTMIMGGTLFVSTFFSSVLTDIAGRRPLLLISSIGCALSLFIISVYLYVKDKTSYDVAHLGWIPPVFIMVYCLLLSFGIEPVSMIYRSEMFPANTRGIAASINSLNFSIGAFLTIKFYQVFDDVVGLYFIYFLFSMSCLVGSVLIYIYAIETKGKTLAEVQEQIARSVGDPSQSNIELTKC